MDIEAYFSRSRELFEQHHDEDHPECQNPDFPVSCGSAENEQLESSSNQYCHSYKDDCVPVIFDRRYNFADRELCSRHFSVRLGGLRNKMAAVLRGYIGCNVVIGTDCDDHFNKIHGRLTFVGTDFVEMALHKCKQHSKKKYRMIPFDTINWFEMDQEENA
ncbi:hypothetical protein [Mesobacillus jeotgali]|uniref:Uncharacterized protein n=1 Tax=Mesobacillus jeotgali TaxID=129985 RepID=A0ABY9VB61_9BACI|nr:hypothetical protein [Mesobacillus jeotgali]WNF21035.1 hypothetical protein RH061_12565 [Mesobacillus jeotgali]